MKTQFKMLFLSVLFMFVAQATHAQDFYIGGTAGVGSLDARSKLSSYITEERHTGHGGGTSFIGGGILGIDTTFCDNFYVAVEGRALYNSFSRDVRSTTDGTGALLRSVNIKNNFIYGADLKLGMVLDCCTIPYVLVGVEVGRWKTRISNDSDTSSGGIPPLSSVSFSKDKAAPKAGLGVRFPLCDIFNVDLQYSYTWFRHFNHRFEDTLIGDIWNGKTRVGQHKFMVSLNYSFSFFNLF